MRCPICKSKKIDYFAEKKEYIFNRCVSCKTIFLSSLPSNRQLQKYYSKQFTYQDGLKNEDIIRKRARIILKKVRQFAPHVKTICDVGSGYGFFLDEAKKQQYKLFGIEPSEELVFHAHSNYQIRCFTGSLDEYINKEPTQFDLVTCIHVVEHIRKPKKFISQLLKLIKPGGILFIETPNSDSHLLYVEKGDYTFLIPPDHLWLFSKNSFKYLCKKSTIISVNTYSYSEHFMGIIKKLLGRTKNTNNVLTNNTLNIRIFRVRKTKRIIFYYLFDKILAPLFTRLLNIHHKGSILELYIRKN